MTTVTQITPNQSEQPTTSATPDLASLKIRQQAAWSSGNYAIVGTTLQIVGEELCEALDLRSASKVLDVAARNGMITLAAARRWCDVTSTDYVPALLEAGRARALPRRTPPSMERRRERALAHLPRQGRELHFKPAISQSIHQSQFFSVCAPFPGNEARAKHDR